MNVTEVLFDNVTSRYNVTQRWYQGMNLVHESANMEIEYNPKCAIVFKESKSARLEVLLDPDTIKNEYWLNYTCPEMIGYRIEWERDDVV
jgi:hypothetical protein